MATSERQKIYNERYRRKTAKIKSFAKELDQLVAALEKLPACAACDAVSRELKPYRKACEHTPERRKLIVETALVRDHLEQLDH